MIQAANLAVAKDKNCPAEHFWQRQVRLPGHPSIKKDIVVGEQIKIRKERQDKLLGKRFSNRAFTDQQKVRIQDPKTRLWNTKGVIVGSRVGDDGATTSRRKRRGHSGGQLGMCGRESHISATVSRNVSVSC